MGVIQSFLASLMTVGPHKSRFECKLLVSTLPLCPFIVSLPGWPKLGSFWFLCRPRSSCLILVFWKHWVSPKECDLIITLASLVLMLLILSICVFSIVTSKIHFTFLKLFKGGWIFHVSLLRSSSSAAGYSAVDSSDNQYRDRKGKTHPE